MSQVGKEPASLLVLPAELLLIIISYVHMDHSLKPLSTVNTYLRRLCVPSLFRILKVAFSHAGLNRLEQASRSKVAAPFVEVILYEVPELIDPCEHSVNKDKLRYPINWFSDARLGFIPVLYIPPCRISPGSKGFPLENLWRRDPVFHNIFILQLPISRTTDDPPRGQRHKSSLCSAIAIFAVEHHPPPFYRWHSATIPMVCRSCIPGWARIISGPPGENDRSYNSS